MLLNTFQATLDAFHRVETLQKKARIFGLT